MKPFTERHKLREGGVRSEFHSRPFTEASFHAIRIIVDSFIDGSFLKCDFLQISLALLLEPHRPMCVLLDFLVIIILKNRVVHASSSCAEPVEICNENEITASFHPFSMFLDVGK